MILNDLSFEQTARAVYIMNPSAQERFDSWEELESFMRSMAYQYCGNSNSFGTSGFQLTGFNCGKERCVFASVQAYTALKYAEAMSNSLEIAFGEHV